MPARLSTVLILDANQRSALAVTRSLGRIPNLSLITADSSSEGLAGHSRFCHSYVQHPAIHEAPDRFADWLVDFVKKQNVDWIFPATEISSQTILPLTDKLAPCRIPFADIDKVMQLADKHRLVELAKKLNILHPASRYFSSSAALDIREIHQFPVVLKPCLSRIRTVSGWIDSAVHIVRDTSTLTRLLQEEKYFREYPFMVQEYIEGHGAGVFALYNRGQAVAFFAHKRLREKPPAGGVSTLSESVRPDARMLAAAKQLLDAVAWHGVAMVEFRVMPDNTPYLMEINTRFWGSLQLAIDAGVDFPRLLYQASNGEPIPAVGNYKIGQRLRWLLGDVDSLYLALRDKKHFTQLEKLKRLIDFFRPHPFTTRHEVNRWNDLAPAWFELKRYLRALFS